MGNVQWQQTLVEDATTDDTLNAIIRFVNIYKDSPFAIEAVNIIKEHSDGTDNDFLRTLFEWACRNINYKLDASGTEVIATPDLSVRNGTADCKKYAILLGSILAAAGYTPMFKHVEYADDTAWTHIYVIVPHADFNPDKRDTYTVLDPTNDCKYNAEVRYKSGELYDLNGSTMKVVAMGKKPTAGCGCQDNHQSDWGNAGSKVIGIIESGAKTQQIHIPTDLSQQRGAVRTLIRNNVHGLADAMLNEMSQNPDALSGVWAGYGGDPDALKTDVLVGIQHQPVAMMGNLHKQLPITPHISMRRNTPGAIAGLNSRYSGVGASPFPLNNSNGGYPQFDGSTFILNPSTKATVSAALAADPHWIYFAQGDNVGDVGSAAHIAWALAACNASQAEAQAVYDWWMGGAQGKNMCAAGDVSTLQSFQARCTGAAANNPKYNGSLQSFMAGEGVAHGTPQVPASPAPCPSSSGSGGGTLCGAISVGVNVLGGLGSAATGGLSGMLSGTIGGMIGNAAGCNASASSGGGGGAPPPPPPSDPTGSNQPGGQTTGGSFGSIGGFFFKTMLIGCYSMQTPVWRFLWTHGLNAIWAPGTIIITSYLIFKQWKKR